ncbi:MAG: winged helix-turn-helix domain-containing protein [Novosphingobium sp.]
MTVSNHVILTSDREDLLAALAEALPDVQVHVVGTTPCIGRSDGRIWCFVDWLLPTISGIEMCRRLREYPATARSHITMVLDKMDMETCGRAISCGADDYMEGPLAPEPLIGRIKEYLSAAGPNQQQSVLTHGDLTVDLVAHIARWRNKPVELMPNQLRLLGHFIEHPDQVFTRSSLIAVLGKDGLAMDERSVDVWVGRLRRALRAKGAPDLLRTVRGIGYVLDKAS